jgi:hypothetical protein
MNISITIMGHPKRDASIQKLLIAIVNMQRFCDVSVTLDTENSEWHTGRRALLAGVGKGQWHVVIQDDAILTPDFYENIERAIAAIGDKTLISLYTGTSRPLGERVSAAVAKAKDGEFLRHHQLFWGVGIAIPSDHIEPMLEFVEDIELQYDNKIGEFYCQNGLPVYYTIPSLVDHDDDLGSLLEGHGIAPEPRVAHRLATGLVHWTKRHYYI